MSLTMKERPEDRIIRAATACFRRWGVAKTSMANIAEAAGMQRSQLYRHFETKEALIIKTMVQATRELSERRMSRFPLKGPVGPLMIEILVVGHQELMADEFATHLIGHGARAFMQLISEVPEIRQAQLTWWELVIAYGQRRGEIRDDLTPDEITNWFLLSQINMVEYAERYPTVDDVRDHIAKFVVPAVLTRV
jgi:AcrR family transcriptional regulator